MATLQELLNHTSSVLLRDRPTTIVGGVSEHLWSDDVIVVLLNQAQDLFARYTFCLKDGSTAAVTQLSLTEVGGAEYTLHAKILRVLSARLSVAENDLIRTDHAEIFSSDASLTGKPVYFATDSASKRIVFKPAPDQAYTCNMRVARLPLNRLSLSSLQASPEIPEQYHYALCDYAAYLALTMPDVDGFAPEQAAIYYGRFKEALRTGRQDVNRAEMSHNRFLFGGW